MECYAVDARNGKIDPTTNGTLQAKPGGGISLNLNNVVLVANSSGGDISGTLDASYYKGQGVRQGVEREFVVIEVQKNDRSE